MEEPIPSGQRAALAGFAVLQALLMVTGIALAFKYFPNAKDLPASRDALQSGFSGFLAAFHYWGSATAILFGVLTLTVILYSGLGATMRKHWVPFLVLLLTTIGLQITGNALPADRHDVQTVAMEAGIAGGVPVAGEKVSQLMLQGSEFSMKTLGFWYQLHLILVPVAILALIWLGLTLRKTRAAAMTFLETGIGVLFLVAPLVLAFALPRATGELFDASDIGTQTAAPSWYVLPLHALLRGASSIAPSLGWVGSALVPPILVLVLLSAGTWAPKLKDGARKGLVLAGLAAFGILMIAFGSAPAPISGNQPVAKVETSNQSGSAIDIALARQGSRAYSENCGGCHGMKLQGTAMAPKLENVHKKWPDPEPYLGFIKDPTSVRKGSTMPSFEHLGDATIRALAEFLRDPKKDY